ncbi:hypothetical protein EMIHUDRAFT_243785 [Emiliania huxleyi CCMP1516]|uniref:ADF-H domain-containing protein n=2 Tax=Emiliania huxleyi TaxID=2903 RepID=A0A0D3J4U0_EMIH1|nr:hypothetical protein EMIHUDRAFT_243785 [Emiliania huxleyi CCMP1516]EOD18525.1 hypothetical protein EMIHUDRAFT_243785 [Emiliania huxleyi CCMP1516]|eukprot:XP_005770954.1 hypothetical protein EMIHUDRAFT_243785 [Emiliania huxleyi CCMP1516]
MATRNLGTMSDSVLQDYHTRRHTSGLNTEELEAPLALVHSTSRINWLTARYDPDDSQRLQLLATGEGGFEELLGSLDDNLVIYGCFMFAAANQVKCAFVSWVGEGVSGLERARVSMHRSDMQAFVQPVASFDIQEREVPAALSAAVKASIATQARLARPRHALSCVHRHYVYGELRIPFEAEDGWMRVRETSLPQNWLLLSYSRADPDLVEIVGEGDDGLAALRAAACDSGRVYWAFFLVVGVDTRRGVVSRRPKYVFATVGGAEVDVRTRTRALLHTGAVGAVLQEAHLHCEVESAEELSDAAVAARLAQIGGAHRPNGYDFGDGGGAVRVEEE